MAGLEGITGLGELLRSTDPGMTQGPNSLGDINRTLSRMGVDGVSDPGRVDGSSRASFDTMLTDLISQVDATQKEGRAEARKLMAGESDNLHASVIAMQEASVAFTLLVETRNKLVESYQEIMRMQV